ncbi:MAG: hypothetical protein Q9174_002408 [Haloplaca sp. 1 TL-2023]
MSQIHETLSSPTLRLLLDLDEGESQIFEHGWMQYVKNRLQLWMLSDQEEALQDRSEKLYQIGTAALNAFLQSNVTGPPLDWNPVDILFPSSISSNIKKLEDVRRRLILDLSEDGEAVYKLISNVELFCLAKGLLNHTSLLTIQSPSNHRWARATVNFWHQKLLGENAASLQESIYHDLDQLAESIGSSSLEEKALRLVQRATIHTQHGFDAKARDDLRQAARESGFEFKLTGRLGKRTKFQEKDLSQLVVLAKSAGTNGPAHQGERNSSGLESTDVTKVASQPEALDLNDDTLLETLAFSKSPTDKASPEETDISPSLAAIDPSNQPTLQPLDLIILLAYASSITNTSPADGLTREETLPYATRVLQGNSTNWQVYTQALLVRSRIEGYKSRTVERGVLQLQALVDQVIVETSAKSSSNPSIRVSDGSETSSFLPRPKPSEAAPASERLAYIHQLASPTRWELEAELASRWVSLGGLRTALEIYERLQMWPEVALCWAANDREDKARKIVRRQLYTSASADTTVDGNNPSIDEDDTAVNELTILQNPLPADSPRLFCILGDLEKSPEMYERAWDVSKNRYARAQRSLGKHFFNEGELHKSEEAYSKSLKVNALNHGTWFSLGCIRLQIEDWSGAVDAFARAIQIEDTDAECWSNLAAALLQLPADDPVNDGKEELKLTDENADVQGVKVDPQKHIYSAFTALKRAAALKRESHRIWTNLLNVAVRLSPPPYTDIIIAQTRLIDLLSKSQGEGCVDVEVMEGLVGHFIAVPPSGYIPNAKPGFEKMFLDLFEKRITPLITTSRRLHLLTAKLSLHLSRPFAALAAYEKAWRVATGQFDTASAASEAQWTDVVDATIDLVDAYESLGERQKEGASEGEKVAKDWRFKIRSAIRGAMGRGRDVWNESGGYALLEKRLVELKGS